MEWKWISNIELQKVLHKNYKRLHIQHDRKNHIELLMQSATQVIKVLVSTPVIDAHLWWVLQVHFHDDSHHQVN